MIYDNIDDVQQVNEKKYTTCFHEKFQVFHYFFVKEKTFSSSFNFFNFPPSSQNLQE